MSARMCGTCHNVKHVVYETDLETTYDEWYNSPYNSDNPEEAVNCLGCHMYQRPGVPATGSTERPENPGKAAFNSKEREHIFTHYFIGGNTLIPQINGNEERVKMVEERLQNAAELSVGDSDISDNTFSIIVTNVGAGHNLPTGLTDVRVMWLEVVLTDSEGKTIFQSGKAGEDGLLPENTVKYKTVFGDGNGNEVPNITQAKEILYDKRIPPKESMEEVYTIENAHSGDLKLYVRLLYSGVAQEISDSLYGKAELMIPVTVMEEMEYSF
jgi:hypothetical protein